MTDPERGQRRIVNLRIQGVGPLTRTTLGDEPVDPREQAINDALHWIWSWGVQVGRIRESFAAEMSQSSGIAGRRAASRFTLDEHLLAVIGWNLARALVIVERYVPTIRLETEQREALRLLRHLYEHWDEQREPFRTSDEPKQRAGAAFAAQFPGGRPWSIVSNREDR